MHNVVGAGGIVAWSQIGVMSAEAGPVAAARENLHRGRPRGRHLRRRRPLARGRAHASFGDYGRQAGDGTAEISDADMEAEVTALVAEFLAGVER